MAKRGRSLIAVFAIALLGVLAWGLFRGQTSEPIAQGKPLSYWLTQLDQGTNYDQGARDQAQSAVRMIGTNALPVLLQMLRVQDTPLKTKLLTWVSGHSFGKIRYTSPREIRGRAALGFWVLGPKAASAYPEVIKILGQTRAFELASHLEVGMQEEDAVKYLKRNGLSGGIGLGEDSFGWGQVFALSNDCSLVLYIQPKTRTLGGPRGDGIVRRAFIWCYGAGIVSIPLTNAPMLPNR